MFWENIGAPPFIIDCIREGYKIPFYVSPLPAEFSNNRSALEHSEFVHSAIFELLPSGRVCQVPKSCYQSVFCFGSKLREKTFDFGFKVHQSPRF